MAILTASGIEVALPAGWEGRIFRRASTGLTRAYPVAHLATFPLSADMADFGGAVPETMGSTDIFAVLFEYGPESLGTALFARPRLPQPLAPSDFRPYTLRRGVGGQSGTQWFFTEQRRPFTLYVVLGSHARRAGLVPELNRLLDRITIHPAGRLGAA
jgi:hypothetical protein